MNIKRKYNYFYKITNKLNGMFYYGVHSTDNLDDEYIGSGSALHKAYHEFGIENFTKEILKFFDSRDEANKYERFIVNEDMVLNKKCYNLSLGGGYDTTCNVTIVDNNGKFFNVPINDERYLNGELHGLSYGRISTVDKYGVEHRILPTDERYLSGEFIKYKRKLSEKQIKKMSETFKGKITLKDKDNNAVYSSIYDERYLTSELVPYWKGLKHSEETKLKMKTTHKLNKHQQGSKNSQYGTMWITNDIENKKIKNTDIIPNGWHKGRICK